MGKILENLNLTLLIGIFIAIALMMAPYYAPATIAIGLLQWLHVFFGVLWIGLLYYFNFVQIPTMPEGNSPALLPLFYVVGGFLSAFMAAGAGLVAYGLRGEAEGGRKPD